MDPAVGAVIARHTAYGDAHYPTESNHHLHVADYADSDVHLFAAWEDETCLGMAGFRVFDPGKAELKSMFVEPAARGRGVGTQLISCVTEAALAAGVSEIYLETGSQDASAAARRLYEALGFTYCAPFDSYVPDPESVFMVRALGE